MYISLIVSTGKIYKVSKKKSLLKWEYKHKEKNGIEENGEEGITYKRVHDKRKYSIVLNVA